MKPAVSDFRLRGYRVQVLSGFTTVLIYKPNKNECIVLLFMRVLDYGYISMLFLTAPILNPKPCTKPLLDKACQKEPFGLHRPQKG